MNTIKFYLKCCPFFCVYSRWTYLEKHWPVSSQPLALLIIFLLSWGIASSLLPEYVKPNSVITRMLFLFIGAQFCGTLVSFTGLPDMLGMLFWGGVNTENKNKKLYKCKMLLKLFLDYFVLFLIYTYFFFLSLQCCLKMLDGETLMVTINWKLL